ncbi:MAG: DUF192 domain-containing protein [Gemmatimonadota bacterium]
MRVRNERTGAVLADRVQRTRGAREGARGLLGRSGLEPGEGLWIVGSMGVHSFGMRFPIDVAYLDGDLRVLHVIETMKPNRLGRLSPRTETVLELPAGTLAASGTRRGDRLAFERDPTDAPASTAAEDPSQPR